MWKNFKDKLNYFFEIFLSKGTIAKIGILGTITFAVVIIVGLLTVVIGPNDGVGKQIWYSFMHVLDTGNIAGDYDKSVVYNVLMTIATLCGILVTSSLFGIITTGLEAKLRELNKGNTRIMEQAHTIIIGFNSTIYTLLAELIQANENHPNSCIVIIGDEDKEYMDNQIASHIPDFKTTKIICRSGDISSSYIFEKSALENCKAVIVNENNDASVIKTIMAITHYLEDKNLYCKDMHIVAAIRNKSNLEVAQLIGNNRAQIIYAEEFVSKIIAHTCRHKGLSRFIYEFLNYSGCEVYYESIPKVVGKTFGLIRNQFSNAAVLGIYRDEKNLINPPEDTVLQNDDKVILFEQDDGAFLYEPHKVDVNPKNIVSGSLTTTATSDMLILGSNEKLGKILEEYDKYSNPDTTVTVISEQDLSVNSSTLNNIALTHIKKNPSDRSFLERFLRDKTVSILLLSDSDKAPSEADEANIIRLAYLRHIAAKTNCKFQITTEMKLTENEHIARINDAQDFVVSEDIVSLFQAQISENRDLADLFNELLSDQGSEIYMKPVNSYVRTDTEVNFYDVTAAAAKKGEAAIGCICYEGDLINIVSCPVKSTKFCFSSRDSIVVIARN